MLQRRSVLDGTFFSCKIHQGVEKNMSFLLIPKSVKVWKKELKQSDQDPLNLHSWENSSGAIKERFKESCLEYLQLKLELNEKWLIQTAKSYQRQTNYVLNPNSLTGKLKSAIFYHLSYHSIAGPVSMDASWSGGALNRVSRIKMLSKNSNCWKVPWASPENVSFIIVWTLSC